MFFFQKQLTLPAHKRGFHLITQTIVREFAEVRQISLGLLHVFIQHTSASLTISENTDPRDWPSVWSSRVYVIEISSITKDGIQFSDADECRETFGTVDAVTLVLNIW